MIELAYESVVFQDAIYIKLNRMCVTARNIPSDARPVGSSRSVSGEDEYIPSKEVRPYGQKDCVEIYSLFLLTTW